MIWRLLKRRFGTSKRIATKVVIVLTIAVCVLNLRRKKYGHYLKEISEVEGRRPITEIEDSKLVARLAKHLDEYEEPSCLLDLHGNSEFFPKDPVFKLNPLRFIMPVLVQGSNNQLIGFRDSIFLAIMLNRTLIMPAFFQHRSEKMVETNLRININIISKFVSVVSHSHWQDFCPDFDDIYTTKYTVNASKMFYNESNNGIHVLTATSSHKNVYPLEKKESFNSLKISDPNLLKRLYSSAGKCALYLHPFRSVGIKENTASLLRMQHTAADILKSTKYGFNTESLRPHDLYALIVHATPQPTYASNIATQFLSQISGRLLAVHWRYDKDDWLTRCFNIDKLSNKGKNELLVLCEKLLKTTPQDVARGIHLFIKGLSISHRPDSIYITTPLTMLNFTTQMKSHINSMVKNVKVYYQHDLHEFVFQAYQSCDEVLDNYKEITSQVEMSICTQASIFLRSPMSSWSKVIQEKRLIRSIDALDGGILDLII